MPAHTCCTCRNRDAVFTLEALREFALLAYNYARVHRNQEAAFMVTGYASLKLWSALHQDHQQQIDWVVSLLTTGYATACLLSNKQLVVHQKALKAMHTLFDMEVSHVTLLKRCVQLVCACFTQHAAKQQCPGRVVRRCVRRSGAVAVSVTTLSSCHRQTRLTVAHDLLLLPAVLQRNHNISYQVLKDMVRNAAVEEQLIDSRSPLWEKWVPVDVLSIFATSMVEGMANIMGSFSSDPGELKEVVRKADMALTDQSRHRGRSSAGGVLTPLNLKKQLHNARY
jgi:hypothetical protein